MPSDTHRPGSPNAPSLPSMVTVVSRAVLVSAGLQETFSWPVQVTSPVSADAAGTIMATEALVATSTTSTVSILPLCVCFMFILSRISGLARKIWALG